MYSKPIESICFTPVNILLDFSPVFPSDRTVVESSMYLYTSPFEKRTKVVLNIPEIEEMTISLFFAVVVVVFVVVVTVLVVEVACDTVVVGCWVVSALVVVVAISEDTFLGVLQPDKVVEKSDISKIIAITLVVFFIESLFHIFV